MSDADAVRYTYYKHSGAFDFFSPVYMILLGGIGALVLGGIYGVVTRFMPIVEITIVMTIGLGVAVGWLVGKGGELGKVRSRAVLTVFGVLLGLFADYVGWITWLLACTEFEYLVVNPAGLLAVLREIAKEGAWSFGFVEGFTPTGVVLYAIWTVEAALIAGASAFFAWKALRHLPFCGACRRWVKDKKELPPREMVAIKSELRNNLERGDVTALTALKPGFKGKSWTEIELLSCSGCRDFHLLTVKSKRVTVDSKGKRHESEDDIVRNLIIDRPAYEAISQPPAQPPADETPGVAQPPAS